MGAPLLGGWGFSTSLSCRFENFTACVEISLLISASLGGETYRVSLSAISISRCRAGEWPDDNIMYILGRSHLFPGLRIWPIFCQWNRIITIVFCVWSVASCISMELVLSKCTFFLSYSYLILFMFFWSERTHNLIRSSRSWHYFSLRITTTFSYRLLMWWVRFPSCATFYVEKKFSSRDSYL